MARSKSKQSSKKFSKALADNPISTLYYLKPDITFKVLEQTGPQHCPKFTMKVDMDSNCFFGIGKSKKEAKFKAALAALEHLEYDFSRTFKISPHRDVSKQVLASTSKQCVKNPKNDISSQHITKNALELVKKSDSVNQIDACLGKTDLLKSYEKHPIALLTSLNYKVTITRSEIVQQTASAQSASFKMVVNVNGQSFYGIGRSRKEAKFKAATTALECLGYEPSNIYEISTNQETVSKEVAATSKHSFDTEKKDISIQHISENILRNDSCPVDQINVACLARTNLVENDEEDPISKLNALNYKITSSEVYLSRCTQNTSFKMKVVVNGKTFYGTGKSKKSAELQAAFIALRYFENCDPEKAVQISPCTASQIKETERISKEEQLKFLQKQMQILNEVYPINPYYYDDYDQTDLISRDQDNTEL